MKQHKDRAIILSRVDYGERDRILRILCRTGGKISVLAKGVRSTKSRLAGGVELLSETDVSYVEGRSSIMALTSARLHQHFGNIVQDMQRMQTAFAHIKAVNKIADEAAGQEYYSVLVCSLTCLNDLAYEWRIVDIWFSMQVLHISGSAPNLEANSGDYFEFNHDAQQFIPVREGPFSRNDLKVLRLCMSSARPPRLQQVLGSEERLQQLVQTLLRTNVTEL